MSSFEEKWQEVTDRVKAASVVTGYREYTESIWCERCALPAAVTIREFGMSAHGVALTSGGTFCRQCGQTLAHTLVDLVAFQALMGLPPRRNA